MPSFTNGVYNIRNVGRGLMLNLKGNSTAEGNQIQGYTEDHTVAQQVSIRVHTHFVTGSHTHHVC
jgi:hypothetical protein